MGYSIVSVFRRFLRLNPPPETRADSAEGFAKISNICNYSPR